MATSRAFEFELRKALNHIYDPAFLRKSPLVARLGLEGSANRGAALRDALLVAIEALSQGAGAKSRQVHQLLFTRYVQQLTQGDVANQLAVSPRHIRRLQAEALLALADYLRDHYDLLEAPAASADVPSEISEVDRELQTLDGRLVDRWAIVEPLVTEALELARDMAVQKGVRLEASILPALPPAAAPETLLKELLLSLVVSALQAVPGGRVTVAAEPHEGAIALELRAEPAHASPRKRLQWDDEALAMSRRLAALCKGELAVLDAAEAAALRARILIPMGEQTVVLAIEDSADTLQLWERYLQDSPFTLVRETEPERALATAERVGPAVIVLDLMMPGTDGWKLLARLRHNLATSAIPIVVCSVLPQKELALSLGASDFIRKPTTRQGFREALQRQSAAAGRGSGPPRQP